MAILGKALSVDLAERRVLDRVDAKLGRGELVGIIGPNGAGKSTLLRVLAGLLRPAAGELRIDGATIADLGRKTLARRIAFLAQEGHAAWSLTAGALVGLGRLPHRLPFAGAGAADREAVARAMALADVAAFADRPVGSLSGGERRRVMLARALAVEADYLLADEPLAGLDPGHQLETLRLLRTIAEGGAGVAIVLHDLSLASRFCDRLLLLDRGRLIAEGRPDEVLTDERLAAVFGISIVRADHASTSFIMPWTAIPRSIAND